MKRERGKLSRHNEVAKAFDYMLKRIDVFTRFLDDGRICLTQLRGFQNKYSCASIACEPSDVLGTTRSG